MPLASVARKHGYLKQVNGATVDHGSTRPLVIVSGSARRTVLTRERFNVGDVLVLSEKWRLTLVASTGDSFAPEREYGRWTTTPGAR